MRSRTLSIAACLSMAAVTSMLPATAADDFVEGEVIVRFKENVATAMAKDSLSKRSLQLARQFDRFSGRRVSGLVRDRKRTTAQLLADLKNDPTVEIAEPNFIRTPFLKRPNDPGLSKLWAMENTGQTVNGKTGVSGADVRYFPASNLSRPASSSSQEIVIAVIDTGVDITHPDLAANIWTNTLEIPGDNIDNDGNGCIDDVHGYDFGLLTGDITDGDLHGTHVAGTIAAVGHNSLGVIGLQPRVKILPLKVTYFSTFSNDAILAAYNYVIALKNRAVNPVNIVAVNASYGGANYSAIESSAMEALRDAGIVLCAATGNSTTNTDVTPNYPSCYSSSNIIAVCALDQQNGLAGFSSYGATTADIAAPGDNIYSTIPSRFGRTTSLTVNGTSYATRELEYAGTTTATGLTKVIRYCGFGAVAGNFPSNVRNNIALIQRGGGEVTFATKLENARAAGAVGVIMYNNVSEPLSAGSWTLGYQDSTWLPAVQITLADGEAIRAQIPTGSATLSGTIINAITPANAYDYQNGTSMAAPQVSAAIAFAATNFPTETMSQRISRVLTNKTSVAAMAGKMTTGGRLDLLRMVDTDLDGLPDWWEMDHFNTLDKTPAADDDGDGLSNVGEYLANTDPKSGGSLLTFSSYTPLSGGGAGFQLLFPTIADRSYQVEWSPSLLPDSWTPIGSAMEGTGGPLQITDPSPVAAGSRFYRLRILHN